VINLGLTGGIASGKSTAGALLADLGAVLIDSDTLARDVVAPGTAGLAAVVERFGPAVLRADGRLDRPALGRIVFADDAARADLNAIVHPLVRETARALRDGAPEDAVVVHMIPLLVETGQEDDFDLLVVVDVDPEEQVRRVVARDHIDPEQALARIRAQASREERLAVADIVLDNSGTLAELQRQVRALWEGPIAELRLADQS